MLYKGIPVAIKGRHWPIRPCVLLPSKVHYSILMLVLLQLHQYIIVGQTAAHDYYWPIMQQMASAHFALQLSR